MSTLFCSRNYNIISSETRRSNCLLLNRDQNTRKKVTQRGLCIIKTTVKMIKGRVDEAVLFKSQNSRTI